MSKSFKPEEVTISIDDETIVGFIEVEPEKQLPPLDIILTLPDGKKTGLSLNTEKLIRKIQELYPIEFEELIREIQC